MVESATRALQEPYRSSTGALQTLYQSSTGGLQEPHRSFTGELQDLQRSRALLTLFQAAAVWEKPGQRLPGLLIWILFGFIGFKLFLVLAVVGMFWPQICPEN